MACSTALSGMFFGNALDAELLASEVQRTTSFEDGWQSFHDHLHQLYERSAWIGLVFLILAGFALPRARRAVRRYFPNNRMLQPRPGALLLIGIFLLCGMAGYLLGTVMDRALTMLAVIGTVP